MAKAWRGLRRGEKWVLGAVLFTGAIALAGSLASSWDLERRRRAIAEAVEEEKAALPERPRALVAAMDDVILETAALPYPGDLVDREIAPPRVRAALLASSALYVRAALPEVARLDALGAAVRRSDKDAFVLCLRRPPATDAGADVAAAATSAWIGGALFEDATHDVLPLHAVHAGLRPLSRAWADELASADGHLWVRRLEEEYEERRPLVLSLARTAASADVLVVVVDELPDGMAEPEVGRSLTATRRPAVLPRIEDAAHFVRVAVWSARMRRVVLRVRARVDVAPLRLENPAMVSAHVHACQAALALRGLSL
ncbi:MAG: hypothetical protein KF819_06305 [Labilithrix sp.]|nr:hypothetical protein [Labilithrix sp.]